MKKRNGFVSNSSSASFVIDRKYISQDVLNKICDHEDVAGRDAWEIVAKEDEIVCFTYMDNFDLYDYLIKLGIPEEAIKDVDGENY